MLHTMPRCAVLCCAVLCCAVLCCAVLCCAVLCCAALCCAALCCAVLCWAVLHCPAGLSSSNHADWRPSSDPSSLLVQHHRCGVSTNHDMHLGSPVSYLASHLVDTERCSLFFVVFSFLLTCSCLGLQVSQDAVAAGYRSVPF